MGLGIRGWRQVGLGIGVFDFMQRRTDRSATDLKQ